jgi:hypothetical protein
LPIISIGFHVSILLQPRGDGIPGAISVNCVDGPDKIASSFEGGQGFIGQHRDTSIKIAIY